MALCCISQLFIMLKHHNMVGPESSSFALCLQDLFLSGSHPVLCHGQSTLHYVIVRSETSLLVQRRLAPAHASTHICIESITNHSMKFSQVLLKRSTSSLAYLYSPFKSPPFSPYTLFQANKSFRE